MAKWMLLLMALGGGIASADTLLDPTRPVQPAGSTASAESTPVQHALPVLQGILLGNGPARAWFNGAAWRVGDQIQGYRIRAISAHQVWLERDGQRIPLSVYSDKVKIQ